jgi:Protein of unknown function (DUF3093)
VSTSDRPEPAYRERLRPPVRWWLLLALLVLSLWLAVVVATPPSVMLAVTGIGTALAVGLLLGYGSARVEVGDEALAAGRAQLEWACCGPATPLDREATRRLLGVDADASAYLLTRPYIGTAVRVDVRDPRDPTPYWVLSSRHPERLAASINSARVLAD